MNKRTRAAAFGATATARPPGWGPIPFSSAVGA